MTVHKKRDGKAMKKTVLLVDHPVGRRDDRASRMIAERGFALQWCNPGKGDALPEPEPHHVAAVVYGGAEDLSRDEDELEYLRQEIDWIGRWAGEGRPYLGICLGAQLLARAGGAQVAPHPDGFFEVGYYPVRPTPKSNGFLSGPMHVYHWHKEGFEVPDGADLLVAGDAFPNQAFRFAEGIYGIQFHPEVTSEVMQRWTEAASHYLTMPNAHGREQQVEDCARYDAGMRDWLSSFLDTWLPAAD